MERAAKKCNGAADRLAAGQTADGLVDNRLENGCGQILLVAPSLMSGWISDFAKTPQRAAIG
ncbi:MAG: hypothetical protein ACLR8P_02950 [Clostridium fessum]